MVTPFRNSILTGIVANRNGMALLVTLGIVSVLVAGALGLAGMVRNSADYVKNGADRYRAYQAAMSGIHLACLVLAEDANDNSIDSVQEVWADPEKLSEAAALMGFEEDALTVTITDEMGRIQLNALIRQFPGHAFNEDQKRIWERLLDLAISGDKSLDMRDPSEIVNSIKDWLDSADDDAVTGISGAESAYYQDLDPPYPCSNGPFNRVSELFMVKGIDRGLLERKAGDMTEMSDLYKAQVDDIFTVYGMDDTPPEEGAFCFPGRVNINTAGVAVLAALLPPGMEDQARELADFREHKEREEFTNNLDKGWYKQVIELSESEQEDFEKVIQYASRFFRAQSTASVNDAVVTVTAFIRRQKDDETNRWTSRIVQLEKE